MASSLWHPRPAGFLPSAGRWRRSQGGAFAPTDISGCAFWVRSDLGVYQDAGSTPASSDTDPIGQWNDQSGISRHLSQSTVGNKPAFRTNVINSLPVIRFDGTSDSLTGANWNSVGLTAAETFLVLKIDADSPPDNAHSGLWYVASEANNVLYRFAADGHIYDNFGSTSRRAYQPTAGILASWHCYNVITTSSEWTSSINGGQIGTDATNTVGWPNAACKLGESVTAATFFLDGDVAEWIIYDAKLSDPNRALVETYLGTRYSITFS